jgi:hypothetical protein
MSYDIEVWAPLPADRRGSAPVGGEAVRHAGARGALLGSFDGWVRHPSGGMTLDGPNEYPDVWAVRPIEL